MTPAGPIMQDVADPAGERRLFDRENGEGSYWLPLFLDFLGRIKIVSKELTEPAPITPYGAQIRFLDEVCSGLDADVHLFVCLKARQLGMCLDPSTRVLTADLRWVPLTDIRVGDELVATDEHAPGQTPNGKKRHRRMRTAIVQAVVSARRRAYRLTLDDGRTLVCSGQHKWLTRKTASDNEWRTIEGNGHRIKVGTQIRWITKPWHADATFDDGWIGGMLDGEGSISNKNLNGASICLAQLPGPVLDRVVGYFADRGYSYRIEDDNTARKTKYGRRPVPKVALTRMDEIFRLLGQTRPTRFIGRRFWEDRDLPGKKSGIGWATVVSIEPLPEQDMLDLQTSTGTYIAEGFVSHNSTIMLALDIFWLWMFPGLQGALIADTAENKDTFKQTIEIMLEGLPAGFKIPVKRHNRNGLLLQNGSRLMYMSAGRRKNSGLARSRGLNFVHATECSSWGDQKGLDSLLASLAEENPNRLYVFESTALGYNLFFEMCETAKAKVLEQRFIFIGWWAKELYRYSVGSAKYVEYWEKKPFLSEDEAKTAREVERLYGHAITTEQWAWYRAQAADKSDASLKEEYPSTEAEAFQSTGNSFFELQKVTTDVAFINSHALMPRPYRVTLGDNFTRMKIHECEAGADGADLSIWEEPNPRGRYVMGVDPATGEAEGDDPDRTVVSIWRGYADKMVQVAEYATTNPTSQQCAWVMSYLAACYRDCMINVEKNGPGLAVMSELRTLRQLIAMGELRDFTMQIGRTGALEGIRWFLYHRADSMGGDYLYNFTSNPKTKSEILNSLRDSYNTDKLIPRSVPLLREMSTLTQKGAKIHGSGRNKDDRVFGAALAQKAWSEWLRPSMMAEKRTFEAERIAQEALEQVRTGEGGTQVAVVDHLIKNFFQAQATSRQEAARNRLLELTNY